MVLSTKCLKISTILILHLITTQAVHEVHEVINEQARSDDSFKLTTGPANIPYGNPLAGNSQQNARLHAQNQQAMFNAERIRQHRAQVQRWNKAPPPLDSYVKAYHDLQDNHQLAVEQQQSNLKDKKAATTPRVATKSRQNRPELKRGVRVIPETLKQNKGEGNKERTRNHRSFGSVRYRNYIQPKAYNSIYISPAPTYDQGVTIKPNGNNGLTTGAAEETKLYTAAIPSQTRYVYPKQFSQMQGYESAKDIEALRALLHKSPQTQISELNSLVSLSNTDSKSVLDTPIDLFFYTKDQPAVKATNMYEDIAPTYASAYMPQFKDHIPIKEDIEDIENPNKDPKVRPFNLQSLVVTPLPLIESTKNTDYFNVEVSSQSPDFKPIEIAEYLKEENKLHLESYHSPVEQYFKTPEHDGDLSERYLHHNAQHVGVHHLHEDGTGTSAYDDSSLQYAANYEFGYRVRDLKSGNDFGHQEAHQDGHTNGQYHVLLPDGRVQNVQYSAGPDGFHADISYDHLKSR